MARPVTVLAAGGTIAMRGERARPALDGPGMVAGVPALAGVADLEVQTLRALPGVQVGLDDALAVARAARAAARSGRGAVVTAGTEPSRPPRRRRTSAPWWSSAGRCTPRAGCARSTRPARSPSPRPRPGRSAGPARRAAILARPERRPALDPSRRDLRVPIVPAALRDDGSLVRAALETGADGLVAVALGAGHAPPAWLEALREAAARVPVALVVRPERGTILRDTYGFDGSERDLRASGALPAGLLSPAAARITLLACLGAGLDRDGTRAVLALSDP